MMPTTTTARRVFPMDLPPAIADAICREPDHEPHWLALSRYLDDNGEYDLAMVVRHHCPVFRESSDSGRSVEDGLRTFSVRDAARVARRAREAEERELTDRAHYLTRS